MTASFSEENLNDSVNNTRRHDIDWLRVILFALLIWFHYAVFSLGQLEGDFNNLEFYNIPLFMVIGIMHQWRLAALFVISGMGTAFALRRRTWNTYIKERGIRLGIPLLFGTYILSFGIFEPVNTIQKLFTIFPGIDEMPYGHLWFVYNLLIYSVILTPLFIYVKNNPEGRLLGFIRSILTFRFGILLIPPTILAINGILFKPWEFGEVGMWWEFPRYLLYFLFGFLMISAKEQYFEALNRTRKFVTIFTPILAVIWFLLQESEIPNIMEGGWVKQGFDPFFPEVIIASIIQSFHAWFWCLLIFSWAAKFLNKPNKWLNYLNEAVYPTYIVHMHVTALPMAIFGLLGIGYYIGLTIGTILVMIGVMICFEIIRRASLFRVLFGIKGGKKEVENIYPFNKIEKPEIKILLKIIFHAMTILMTIGLLILIITAGIINSI